MASRAPSSMLRMVPLPRFALADSHIFEGAPGLCDAEEVLQAVSHGDGARLGSGVAVPSAEPCDDPSGPGEGFGGMRIALQRRATFVFCGESGEDLYLLLVEGEAGRLGPLAVGGLAEVQRDGGGR